MSERWSAISPQQKTEMLLTVIDHGMNSVIIADEAQQIIFFNRSAQATFGYSEQEVIGKPLSQLIPERFREAHSSHFYDFAHASVTSRPSGEIGSIYGIRSNGDEFPGHARIANLGNGYYMVCIIDRSELEELTDNLKRQVSELDAFTYSVAHDLRAPLRSITGFIEVLHDDYKDKFDATGQYFLSLIAKNAERMGNLIDDLLAFSRLSNQLITYQKSDMMALAQETYDYLRRGQNGRKITFILNPLPEANVDRSMMRQVWANLISNALKFTQYIENSRVEVGFRNGEYYVSDNGAGFDQKYVSKLFVVFSRLHSTTKYDGTGVGLAIVKRIIERHGGTVRAEGVLNGGATFYFSIGNGNGTKER